MNLTEFKWELKKIKHFWLTFYGCKGMILRYKTKEEQQAIHNEVVKLSLLLGKPLYWLTFPYGDYKDLFISPDEEKFNWKNYAVDLKEGLSPYEYIKFSGDFCGYPDCCINNYIKEIKRHIKSKDKFNFGSSIPYLKYSKQCEEFGIDDIYNLELIEDETSKLVFFGGNIYHVPCHPSCEETKKIHDKHTKMLKDKRIYLLFGLSKTYPFFIKLSKPLPITTTMMLKGLYKIFNKK